MSDKVCSLEVGCSAAEKKFLGRNINYADRAVRDCALDLYVVDNDRFAADLIYANLDRFLFRDFDCVVVGKDS